MTSCKWEFNWLHILFSKKETKLKQCSFSIKPRTWIVAIYVSLKYFGNEWNKNWDTWITRDKQVKWLTMMGLTLSAARATTSTMVWTKFNFIVSFKKPCFTSKSHVKKNVATIGTYFPLQIVHMVVGYNRILLTLPSLKEMSPWHPSTSNITHR
jgi:hypothetical protein